ncbi:urease accessory protein UreD [Campylobacter pinnipediorum subsp. pinnipediorum]|uniref:urease accessory protein UreD n=1 Tax=Campylobacter pinnipediorum TaxID=1965231 RepID=UPI0009958127|nr:urease accessory protein UreD [Campylobacter pinnipediorum]AQW84109.1 urease accessory protein UreD [Campylobacter pinnipediorum subsp. pinnipediorum]
MAKRFSELSLEFENINGVSDIKNMYMTPPLRVMRPFFEDDFTEVMIMSSSPGLLEGDSQKYDFNAKDNTNVKIISQSYEKIHPMNENESAKRDTKISVGKNSTLICSFLPTIMFKDSRFLSNTKIKLEDDSSKLVFAESFVAGRLGKNESFLFREFKSSIEAKIDDELIYFENSKIEPTQIAYNEIGFFEGFDHFASVCIFNFRHIENLNQKIHDTLKEQEDILDIRFGVSSTYRGDTQVRILAKMGQNLMQAIELMVKIL